MSQTETFWKALDQPALFLILQTGDLMTTLTGLSVGLGEANPAIRAFFPLLGPIEGLVLAKVTLAYICYLAVVKLDPEKFWFVNTISACVVIWNLVMITARLYQLI